MYLKYFDSLFERIIKPLFKRTEKRAVLGTCYKALHPQKGPEKPMKPAKQSKKKSSEMEL